MDSPRPNPTNSSVFFGDLHRPQAVSTCSRWRPSFCTRWGHREHLKGDTTSVSPVRLRDIDLHSTCIIVYIDSIYRYIIIYIYTVHIYNVYIIYYILYIIYYIHAFGTIMQSGLAWPLQQDDAHTHTRIEKCNTFNYICIWTRHFRRLYMVGEYPGHK